MVFMNLSLFLNIISNYHYVYLDAILVFCSFKQADVADVPGVSIPINILQQSGFTNEKLKDCINKAITNGTFRDWLQSDNLRSVFKYDEPISKENYGPVSTLPLLLKVFEQFIYNQLSEYMVTIPNRLFCRFWKAHST